MELFYLLCHFYGAYKEHLLDELTSTVHPSVCHKGDLQRCLLTGGAKSSSPADKQRNPRLETQTDDRLINGGIQSDRREGISSQLLVSEHPDICCLPHRCHGNVPTVD